MLYVATKSTAIELDDQSFVLEKGKTELAAGHPLVKARPELFKSTGDPGAADAGAGAEDPPKRSRRH